MILLCFMTGVSIIQSCSHYVSDKERGGASSQLAQDLDLYWSSVSTSMLSLIMASTGGQDWNVMADPLKTIGAPTYAIFVAFIALFNFVVLNVVNSIFLESMMTNAQRDSQFIIDMMLEQKSEYIDKLQLVYDVIDDNGDGEISYEEFCKHSESPELLAFVSSMEIDIADARHFFRVLSCGGKRPVDIQAFVDGCIKLKGMARSLDLMDLVYQHKTTALELKTFLGNLREEISSLGIFVSTKMSSPPPWLPAVLEANTLSPTSTKGSQIQAETGDCAQLPSYEVKESKVAQCPRSGSDTPLRL